MRWRRVAAIGASRSARVGAASWLEEKLVDAQLGEVVEGADPRHVTDWLEGDAEAAAGVPVRDLLSLVGGRFFRIFVAALVREATEDPEGT